MIQAIRLAGWDVPQEFLRRLGDKAGRQRAMLAEGHLLLVLHAVPGPDDFERNPRLFWRPPDGAWKSSAAAYDGLQSLRRHVQEYVLAIEGMEATLAAARTADAYYGVLLEIAPVHRSARNLHATLQEAREAVRDDRDLINLRDRAGEAERAAELLHGDARTGLDFTIARQGEAQALASHRIALQGYRLNLIAATFLPVTALGAAFGMNLLSGLETAGSPWLYWMVLAAGLATGYVLRQAFVREAAEPPAVIATPPVDPKRRGPAR